MILVGLIYTIPVAALLDSGFNPSDPAWQFWLNLMAIALAIIGPPGIVPVIVHFFSKPRKQLSYYPESDAALVDKKKDLEPDMEVLFRGGVLQRPTPINDARLIMYKIMNTGAEVIRDEDFFHKQEKKAILRFRFEDADGAAKLILCAIHHTEPEDLDLGKNRKDILHVNLPEPLDIYVPDHLKRPSLHRYVDLDGITLQKGQAITLKFVTQGRVNKMKPEGGLVGGTVVPYTPSPPVFTVPRILISLVLAVLLVSLITVNGVFRQNRCVLSFSPVSIGGSTAFYGTLQAQSRSYRQGCPFVTVNVYGNDSAAGLLQLEQKNLDIAASEITPHEAGYRYNDLIEHQVAVIVFTMIINKDVTGITSLSQEQITGIYAGKYTSWSQLGGPHVPIVRFGRPAGSGTQAAFTHYVLQKSATALQITPSSTQEMIHQVGSTAGAIGYVDLGSANQASTIVTAININGNAPTPGLVENGVYPFWAIERMYIRNDASNPLLPTFISYVTTNIQTNTTFIRKEDMSPAVLATHK